MLKKILNYILSFLIIAIATLLLIDNIILPAIGNTNKEIYIPDVKGMRIDEGISTLSNFNTKVFYIDYIEGYIPNEILSTSPRAFTKVKEGREIKITVIANQEDIIITDFTNNSLRSAELFLNRNSIKLDTIIYEYSENLKKNNIISQYPKPGNKINNDTKITLIVSLGIPPDYYIVPDLINLSYNKAKIRINESGLLVGNIIYEFVDTLLNNTVIQQDQPPYKRLSMPLEINLIISKDKNNE